MHQVAKRFGATVALAGVDLEVAPGEICGLVGQNGAGKSTLMAILAGALRPDSGVMSVGGRRYAPGNPSEARHAGVAMIQQEHSLAADLTVTENITLGIEPARFGVLDRVRMRQIAAASLAELGHHTDVPLDAPAGQLSSASQQIVEIARALAVGCPVLVLDEPTSSLGPADVDHLFAVLQRLKSQGHAIVYISHFIEEVLRITDRFVVLRDGRNAGGGMTLDATHDDIVSMMVGAAADTVFPRTPRHRGDAILEVDGLEPGRASFTLHRGEIFGIAGLMGSGRTRLLRALFGLAPVRSGRVRVGVYAGTGSPADRWRQGVGLVSEDRTHEGVSLLMSVADNLTLTAVRRFGSAGIVWPARQRAATREWIDRVDIKCTGELQAIAELSGGNQQKVALARLLHHDVDVLILDEPTRGIDVGSKAQIYRLIDSLVSDSAAQPRAILMVSSYLPELVGLCDRIAVMRRGGLGTPQPAERFTEHGLMSAIAAEAHA
jgi:ribose transport system ATP-binding protein